MTQEPLEQELSRALRESTEQASSGFTAAVLTRLEDRAERAPLYRRPSFAIAALLLFVVGALIGLRVGDRSQPAAQAAAERQQLIQEVLALQAELDEIRQLTDDASPVLYLGGNENLDVVYDLRGYDDLVGGADYRPASLPPDRG